MKWIVFLLSTLMLLACNDKKNETANKAGSKQAPKVKQEKSIIKSNKVIHLDSLQETPLAAVKIFFQKFNQKDTIGAYRHLIQRPEYKEMIPVLDQGEGMEPGIFSEMFYQENVKHLQRWMGDFEKDSIEVVGVNLRNVEEKDYGSFVIVSNVDVQIKTKTQAPMNFKGITSFVKLNGKYKIWALNDH